MSRFHKLTRLGLAVMVAGGILGSAACSTSSSTRLRLMNAFPDQSSLDMLVDGRTAASNVSYGTASSYQATSNGGRHIQVEPSGTSTILTDQNVSLSSGGTYTLLVADYSSSVIPALLTDDNSAPDSGDFKLRIVNGSTGLGTVDVYIVTPGTDPNTVSPTISGLAFATASAYQSLTAGSYQVYFKDSGFNYFYIDSGPLTFSAGQVRTLVGLNSQSGGYTVAQLSDSN